MGNAVLSCRCYGRSTDIGCEYLDGSEEGKFGYRGTELEFIEKLHFQVFLGSYLS